MWKVYLITVDWLIMKRSAGAGLSGVSRLLCLHYVVTCVGDTSFNSFYFNYEGINTHYMYKSTKKAVPFKKTERAW